MELTIKKEKSIDKLKLHLERYFANDKVEYFENKPTIFKIKSGVSKVSIHKNGNTFSIKTGINFKNIWIILGVIIGLYILIIEAVVFLGFIWLNSYESRILLQTQTLNSLKAFYGIKD